MYTIIFKYLRREKGEIFVVILYVDDFLIIDNNV